jgi:iron complex transport system substrate-binding protein
MNTPMTVKFPRRRRSTSIAAVVLSATLALAACGSDDDDAAETTDSAAVTTIDRTVATTAESATATTGGATGDTRSVEADNGTIEVPAAPQRVATIGNTTLPFIDLGGKPIAVTEESESDVAKLPTDQQATYASATILAASADEVDLEQLAALTPDLIMVQVPEAEFESIADQLEAIAPTVFYGLDAEWKELADRIAEAGNTTDALSEQKAEFTERLTGITEKYGAIIADTSFVDITRYASSDPGTFAIADIGCSEIARDEVGMDFPSAAEGEDPLAYTAMSFEQLGELSSYDVITYPVDAEGQPTEPFLPVVETNTWQALPAVASGRALGVFCPGNNSYGAVLQYLASLDNALATLPAEE